MSKMGMVVVCVRENMEELIMVNHDQKGQTGITLFYPQRKPESLRGSFIVSFSVWLLAAPLSLGLVV